MSTSDADRGDPAPAAETSLRTRASALAGRPPAARRCAYDELDATVTMAADAIACRRPHAPDARTLDTAFENAYLRETIEARVGDRRSPGREASTHLRWPVSDAAARFAAAFLD